jgi:uncharacterized membrane protein YbhN (UPF0104 family)
MKRKWLVWMRGLLGVLILVAVLQFVRQAGEQWPDIRAQTWRQASHWMIAAALLLPVNYGIEGLKWWYLARIWYEDLSYWQALRAVLIGIAAGLPTPNRVGEYPGRLLCLPSGARTAAAGALFTDRLAQLLCTLIFGLLALVVLANELPARFWMPATIATAILTLFCCIFYIWPVLITGWIVNKISYYYPRIALLVQGLIQMPHSSRRMAFLLSTVRYAVFTFQYALLLAAPAGLADNFGYGVAFAAVVFLLKAAFPGLALAELGIREAVAIVIARWLHLPLVGVLVATLLLSILNLIIPAVVGLVLMYYRSN